MLSAADNALITRTSRGTPVGELFRRFWLPVIHPDELPQPDCPPIRLRLLGEDLVAFRDTSGDMAHNLENGIEPRCATTPDAYRLRALDVLSEDGDLGPVLERYRDEISVTPPA